MQKTGSEHDPFAQPWWQSKPIQWSPGVGPGIFWANTHQFERTVEQVEKSPCEFDKKICCLSIIQESRFGGSPINRSQLIRRNTRKAQMSSSNVLDCLHHAHVNLLTNLLSFFPTLNSSGCRTFTPKELQWRHWKLSLHTQEPFLKPTKNHPKKLHNPKFLFGVKFDPYIFVLEFHCLFVCFTNQKHITNRHQPTRPPKNPTQQTRQPTTAPPPDADSLPSTAEAPASRGYLMTSQPTAM